MRKYKVEILQTDTFVLDVLAKNEKEAQEIAEDKWNDIASNGTQHYYESMDTETKFGTIYDVSETEDPFNP
jgi:hypothetical protein